ncbi:hypothetical protein KSS87_002130 [Heliosperma pusillum]|nr:hypothetical protein KSS87_002130 [Heliosperma pusillum]
MCYRSRVFRYHQTLLLLPSSIVARPPPCCSPSRVAQVVAPGQHRAPLLQVRIIIKFATGRNISRHRNVKPRLGFRSWTLTKLNYFHKLSTIKEMDLTEQMCRCAGKQTEALTSDKSFSMTHKWPRRERF